MPFSPLVTRLRSLTRTSCSPANQTQTHAQITKGHGKNVDLVVALIATSRVLTFLCALPHRAVGEEKSNEWTFVFVFLSHTRGSVCVECNRCKSKQSVRWIFQLRLHSRSGRFLPHFQSTEEKTNDFLHFVLCCENVFHFPIFCILTTLYENIHLTAYI